MNLEFCSDTCRIYDGDRVVCEMSNESTDKDVKLILEAPSGWHLAGDAARGLKVELDGDLGHEADQIRTRHDEMVAAIKEVAAVSMCGECGELCVIFYENEPACLESEPCPEVEKLLKIVNPVWLEREKAQLAARNGG